LLLLLHGDLLLLPFSQVKMPLLLLIEILLLTLQLVHLMLQPYKCQEVLRMHVYDDLTIQVVLFNGRGLLQVLVLVEALEEVYLSLLWLFLCDFLWAMKRLLHAELRGE
jgi:hypothetical protein